MLLSDTQHSSDQSGLVKKCVRQVLVIDSDGTERTAEHVYNLFVPKQDYAFRLTEIPFAHPRQLIQVLPVLRQWAHLGSLLQDAFTASPSSTPSPGLKDSERKLTLGESAQPKGRGGVTQLSLQDLLSPSPAPPQRGLNGIHEGESSGNETKSLQIDITLAGLPQQQPTLTVLFPFASKTRGAELACIILGVGSNGEITIQGQNIVLAAGSSGGGGGVQVPAGKSGDGDDREADRDGKTAAEEREKSDENHGDDGSDDVQREMQRMAQALDVCGGLDIWVEWIRGRYS